MRVLILLSFVGLLTLWPHAESKAQPPNLPAHSASVAQKIPTLSPIIATYDVYVGGLHFLQANVLFQEQGRQYRGRVRAHTYGYWYKVLKWDGDVSSSGHIDGAHLLPVTYRNLDDWRDKPKITSLNFDSHGNISPQFDPPSHDEGRESVSADQRRGSLDPETALLQMLAHVAVNQSCTVTVPVFDGKRRYDLVGQDMGAEDIDDKEYGVFKGQARKCDVDFNMVAGEWKDEREKHRFWEASEGKAGREAFHIWLGKVSPDLPELPVRLESGSVWGLIMVHLSNWHYATSDELKP